jgi:phenylacetic acid degradation operon negative regulatory protein
VFGVEPATTRVTLSRLRQEGWFTTRKVGRETLYRLSDELFAILDEGRDRIFASYPAVWDGWWTQVVFQLPEGARVQRDQLKKRLSWLGFGSVTTGVWLSPREFPDGLAELRQTYPEASVEVLRTRSDDPEQDRRLVARCWDVDDLNRDYVDFIEQHEDLVPTARTLVGADALIGCVSLISTYRHFPFRDPSFPRALRPAGWRGAEAHELFLTLHEAIEPAATRYVQEVVDARLSATAGVV